MTVSLTKANFTAEEISLVCLSFVPGVGSINRKRLLDEFGSADSVLSASVAELCQVQGIGKETAERIRRGRENFDFAELIQSCNEHKLDLLVLGNQQYPRNLAGIPDPPAVLYIRGTLQPEDDLAIGVVGTRHASRYGETQAYRLSQSITKAGMTVVSGLARGIDTVAHRAALDAGGRTIAVLGCGLDEVYPPENAKLADEIAEAGAVVSEQPPLTRPRKGNFPQRNRLITGLSLGVLIVEAALRSGALITAQHAIDQNREVFAVPGPIDNNGSHGCHRLLKDGAKLVERVDDILDELGPLGFQVKDSSGKEVRRPAELKLNDQERIVLEAIDGTPTTIDTVAIRTQLPVSRVLSTISVLESRRVIRRLSGNLVARA